MTVQDLYDRLLEFDVSQELREILHDMEQRVLDLNRKDQLFEKGQNKEGVVIGHYSPLTEEITKGRKKAGDPFNLFDTGDFYKRFRYDYKKGYLDLYSTDNKVDKIFKTIEKQGRVNPNTIFGLTVKNQDILNYQMLMPELIKNLNDALL